MNSVMGVVNWGGCWTKIILLINSGKSIQFSTHKTAPARTTVQSNKILCFTTAFNVYGILFIDEKNIKSWTLIHIHDILDFCLKKNKMN